MQTLLPEYKTATTVKARVTEARHNSPSVGLAIPFQPSMQDDATIQTQLRDAAGAVETKMRNSFDPVSINTVLARLEKLFSKLNYNSHRKSISLMLTPDEEKVIYLNYPVKPVTFLSDHISLLHLTTSVDSQPEFYFLVLGKNNASLYEYHHNKLHRVFMSQSLGSVGTADMFKQVSQTIKILNSKDEKPIFVTGSPNMVELFFNSPYYTTIFFTLLYEVAPFCEEIRTALAKEISNHWDYWQSRFIAGRIMIAQKTNRLKSSVEMVLKALSQSANGSLLLDKNFKRQLYKSSRVNALFNRSDELMNQIERFLTRGNSIGITETGLLKNFGGIVLLPNKPSYYS